MTGPLTLNLCVSEGGGEMMEMAGQENKFE